MSEDDRLVRIRAQMIRPYWEYLEKSFELERAAGSRPVCATVPVVEEEWKEFDKALGCLDSRSRESIRRVFHFELRNLILRCLIEAQHIVPLRQEAGLI